MGERKVGQITTSMVLLFSLISASNSWGQNVHKEALEYAKSLQETIMRRDVNALLRLIEDGMYVYDEPKSKKEITAMLRNKRSEFYLHTFGVEGSALAYFFSFDDIKLEASESNGITRVKYISFTTPFENSISIYLVKREGGFFLLKLFPLEGVDPNEEMARRREQNIKQ